MPDRYGDDSGSAARCCRNGWLTPEDADVQRPCPVHRPPRTDTGVDTPTNLSDRARAAIEKAEDNDQ